MLDSKDVIETGNRRWAVALWLAILTLVAAGLRMAFLGYTFVSSDDIELAHRVIERDGWLWMIEENYGVLISLLVKIHAKLAVAMGVPMTEFVWRLPVAAAGAMAVPVTFFAFAQLGLSRRSGWIAAAAMAVLPIHVFHSRYLWGYEVLGALFAIVAVASLVNFFRTPTTPRGMAAGAWSGLYLVSHGYIVPFFGVLILIPALLGNVEQRNPLRRLWSGLQLYVTKGVIVPIVLAAPIYRYAIAHALEKRTQFGFYGGHTLEIVQNIGVFFFVLTAVAIVVFLWEWRRSRQVLPTEPRDLVTLVFLGVGVGYLVPIFLLTPAGITLTRNYLILGPMFLLFAAVVIAERHGIWQRAWANAVAGACVLVTGWGAFESYYSCDAWLDPTLTTWERGALLPDPGSKAVGYFVRHRVPKDANVLYIHRKFEPPNVGYYCGMDHSFRAFYDRNMLRSRGDFIRCKEWADVVIADPQQIGFFEGSGFQLVERRWGALIFARPKVQLDFSGMPESIVATNERFDAEFAPTINAAVEQPWESRIRSGFAAPPR